MFESHLRLFWRLNPLTKKISFSRGQRWNARSYIWQMSPCLSLARSWWEFTLTEWHEASWVRSWHGSLLAARRNFLRFNQNLDTSQESAGAGNHLVWEPHYHIRWLWPFSSFITTQGRAPIWLVMSCFGGKTWNDPCFVIIDSHRIIILVRPCCNVKISIVRPGSQLGGSCRSWLGLNCTLKRLWFRSWHCLQLSLNFTTHHHMTLEMTVCQKLIFSALSKKTQ